MIYHIEKHVAMFFLDASCGFNCVQFLFGEDEIGDAKKRKKGHHTKKIATLTLQSSLIFSQYK